MKNSSVEEIVIPELEELLKEGPCINAWTLKEEAILEKYYGKIDTKKLAKHLNRTTNSVYYKAKTLGLSHNREIETGDVNE